MKMVKSLLLGTAAGLVAVAGAQAADLPVKAKPVQYVKICSLYGAGFYYIPGTDMCLKVGGWVRAEYAWGVNGSSVASYSADVNNRNTNNSWWRVRGYITADARNQSEYGTIRSYIAVGLSTNTTGGDNAANQFDANKAFIQFAGFTFGRATSFFDFYAGAATSYFGFYPQSDTGDGGKEVLAYTAQFGNGLSASISAESRRNTQIVNIGGTASGAAPACGFTAGGSFSTAGSTITGFGCYGGWQVPDVVGNLRVDQAWGSAQIMGALHQVNAGYYSNSAGASTGIENNGHPGDKWGFAVGFGLKVMVPAIGPGDYLHGQINYTQGALRYLNQNNGSFNTYLQHGQNLAYGVMSDGVYGGNLAAGNASAVELTTGWGVNAAYEHIWNKAWRTSVHGGYYATSYNAAANAMLCQAQGFATGSGTTAVATAGCSNNWSQWWIGSRTQWNISPDTYLGLDVAYASFHSASTPTGLVGSNTIPSSTATTGQVLGNQGNWQARFRVHRDFYP